MTRIKAVYDADIIIHLVKTGALKFALEALNTIYITDYVYKVEISNNTDTKRILEKLKNKGKLKILEIKDLTSQQRLVYWETYNLLKNEVTSDEPAENSINEGERQTAAYAKACNIYYYMSDDNKAAPHIKSLVDVAVVNFCDILFMYYSCIDKGKKDELKVCFNGFVALYDEDKIPNILKDIGLLLPFELIMARCFDKFNRNVSLKALMENVSRNKR